MLARFVTQNSNAAMHNSVHSVRAHGRLAPPTLVLGPSTRQLRRHDAPIAYAQNAGEARARRGACYAASADPSTTSTSTSTSTSSPNNKPSIFEQVKNQGFGGVLAYGVFNTLYYVSAFTVAIVASAKTGALGVGAKAGGSVVFAKLSALLVTVWAGSQVTKLPRAMAALACAPLANRTLDYAADRLPSSWTLARRRTCAFAGVVVLCWALFAAVFAAGYLAVATSA